MATNSSLYFGENAAIPNFALVLERSLNPYEDRSLRVPFYMTSSYRENNGIPGVSMKMNPNSVSFRQPKRITRRNTRGGTVFYHWTDKFGRNNDILDLEFRGVTGNINIRTGTVGRGFTAATETISAATSWATQKLSDLSGASDSGVDTQVTGPHRDSSGASKLASFWNLRSLTTEPVKDPVTGNPIYYYVQYSSPIFANTFITFIGHFSRALDFEDNAAEPFNKPYSFGFTVLSSIPPIELIYTTIVQNLSKQFMNKIT